MTHDLISDDERQRQESCRYWDEMAASFDDAPDHGLRDPIIREAWTILLNTWLLSPQAAILDVGCGTGSLSVLLAELGHIVTGIDLSPAMISRAEMKAAAAGQQITFHVMDAGLPELAPQQFDAIVCRHLLWALPEFPRVLRRWLNLLKGSGRLVLIEGYWNTGGGLHASEIVAALPPSLTHITVQDLSNQSVYWGGEVVDERYAIIADLRE